MNTLDIAARKAQRLTEQVAASAAARATQIMRQFHRIGKSRSDGCRKTLERTATDAMRELRAQLITMLVEVLGPRLDSENAVDAAEGLMESFRQSYLEQFDEHLARMEGYDSEAFATACRAEASEVRADLDEAIFDLGRARAESYRPPSDLSFMKDHKIRQLAEINAEEAARCFVAGAYTATIVFAASVLQAVLRDALSVEPGDVDTSVEEEVAGLLELAGGHGLIDAEAARAAAWTEDRRSLLEPTRVLTSARSLGREEAQLILDLLSEVCYQIGAD